MTEQQPGRQPWDGGPERVPRQGAPTPAEGAVPQPSPQAADAASASSRTARRSSGPVPETRLESLVARGVLRVTGAALAPYQTAVVRIGFAACWLFFLLREWSNRQELYGPDGPWSWDLAKRLVGSNHAFTVLLWSDSGGWFELVYAVAVAASIALLLGWHTRAASVLFMVGVLSLQNRSVFMGDGGDNVVHLMSIYLIFTRCAQVWSLDARRRRRRGLTAPEPGGVALWWVLGAVLVGATVAGETSLGWGLLFWALWLTYGVWWAVDRRAPRSEARAVCDILANVAHNGALLVMIVEVCLIYATAGWYKIQGTRWQDGTAVYYPMHLDYFAPWPALGHLLSSSGVLTLLITYGTVMVQVAFPFTLFNRRVKNVLLVAMITEHLSIAVLLGLPFFSFAMITADAIFLPTAALVWLGARASGVGRRLGLGRGETEGGTEAEAPDDASSTGGPGRAPASGPHADGGGSGPYGEGGTAVRGDAAVALPRQGGAPERPPERP